MRCFKSSSLIEEVFSSGKGCDVTPHCHCRGLDYRRWFSAYLSRRRLASIGARRLLIFLYLIALDLLLARSLRIDTTVHISTIKTHHRRGVMVLQIELQVLSS